MLTLSVTFEVPVGLEFEGFGFQEVLPGRVWGLECAGYYYT
jgi:hypothetical protein